MLLFDGDLPLRGDQVILKNTGKSCGCLLSTITAQDEGVRPSPAETARKATSKALGT